MSLLSQLEEVDACVKKMEEQLSRALEPAPIMSFLVDTIKEHVLSKLHDLQSVLTSAPQVGKQLLRQHISRITLTPRQSDCKRALAVSVEFTLGGGRDSGVLLTGSLDASMQQYGFNTITVTGLLLDTRVVRKRRIPVPNESALTPAQSQPR